MPAGPGGVPTTGEACLAHALGNEIFPEKPELVIYSIFSLTYSVQP